MKLAQFFQDGYGSLSATRLAFLLWVVGVLIVWMYTAFANIGEITKVLDGPVITLLGILMGGKVVQSFSDNDGPKNSSAQNPANPNAVPSIVQPPPDTPPQPVG